MRTKSMMTMSTMLRVHLVFIGLSDKVCLNHIPKFWCAYEFTNSRNSEKYFRAEPRWKNPSDQDTRELIVIKNREGIPPACQGEKLDVGRSGKN